MIKLGRAEELSDFLVVKRFFDDPFVKQADGGFLTNIANELSSLLKSSFDKNRPLESLLDFLAPSLIYTKLGSWKLAALYMIAEKVFGVNFKDIFEYLKNAIIYAVKVGYEFTTENIKKLVDKALETSAPTSPDVSKVPSVLNEIKAIKKESIDKRLQSMDTLRNNFDAFYKLSEEERIKLVKNGGIMEFFSARAILSLLKSLFVFILSNCFMSFKIFLVAAGVAGTILTVFGVKATVDEHGKASPDVPGATQTQGFFSKLFHGGDKPTADSIDVKLPEKLPEVLMNPTSFGSQQHANDRRSIWAEQFPSDSFKSVLLDWIKKVYPGLSGKEDLIRKGKSYNSVVKLFEKNNPPGSERFLTVIPEGFNSIKEIVDASIVSIVNELSGDKS